MYKNEDKIFEFDMMIDNLQLCFDLTKKEIEGFNSLSEKDKAVYKYPYKKIIFLKHQWDKKFRIKMMDEYFRENKVLELKDLVKIKDLFTEKLDFSKSQKH